MRHIIIFMLLCIALATTCQSQDLARKASLGVMLEALNDSLIATHKLKSNEGVMVIDVLENSSASNCGVRKYDVLTEINTNKVNSIRGVIAEVSNVRASEDISLTVVRDGKVLVLKGKAEGRPKETSAYGKVEYGVVDYEGNRLRSILHMPQNISNNPPVVFFIQGYPCQSIDLAFSSDVPTRRLIDDWVKAGYAVFRIEKPGMGDSKSVKPCSEINFDEEIEAFRNGYLSLMRRRDVNTNQVFLFGHSIGGIIAPVLAAEFKPKGVITYGTVVNTWFEYMQELTRVQGVLFNTSDTEIENDIRNATPFWYKLFVEQQTNDVILKDPAIREMLKEEGTLQEFEQGYFLDRHYTYWSGVHSVRLTQVWEEVESKVLALHGEYDIQALNSNHIYAIERIVNGKYPEYAEAFVVEGADHGFVMFDSMAENINTLVSGSYGGYMRQNYHEGISKISLEWMEKTIGY